MLTVSAVKSPSASCFATEVRERVARISSLDSQAASPATASTPAPAITSGPGGKALASAGRSAVEASDATTQPQGWNHWIHASRSATPAVPGCTRTNAWDPALPPRAAAAIST